MFPTQEHSLLAHCHLIVLSLSSLFPHFFMLKFLGSTRRPLAIAHEHRCMYLPSLPRETPYFGNALMYGQQPQHPMPFTQPARGLKLRAALDKVDPSQIAERARKSAFSLAGALPASQLPLCRVGADYPALEEARRAAAAARGTLIHC